MERPTCDGGPLSVKVSFREGVLGSVLFREGEPYECESSAHVEGYAGVDDGDTINRRPLLDDGRLSRPA